MRCVYLYEHSNLIIFFIRPSGHAADKEKYILEQKTVSSAGPLGVIGQIGKSIYQNDTIFFIRLLPLLKFANKDFRSIEFQNFRSENFCGSV